MPRRILSLFLSALLCLMLLPLSGLAVGAEINASYSNGVITYNGSGFSPNTEYTVRLVTSNKILVSMAQAVSDTNGGIHFTDTVGTLTAVNYTVYVNLLDGTQAAQTTLTLGSVPTTYPGGGGTNGGGGTISGGGTSTSSPAPSSAPAAETSAAPTTAPAKSTPAPSPTKTPIPTPVPLPSPEVKNVDVMPTVNAATGAVTANIKDTSTIMKAIDDIKNNDVPGVIAINVRGVTEVKDLEVGIPIPVINKIVDETNASIQINAGGISITFDNDALESIRADKADHETLKVRVASVNPADLPTAVQGVIGDRPVYNFEAISGDDKITEFSGNVTCSIPYTLRPGEDPNAVVMYYINADGNLQAVRSNYNAKTGCVEFVTTHFSKYGIGHNLRSFSDVKKNDWFYSAVTYAAARGITNGTGNGSFSPNNTITRGEIIVMLMKAYHITPDVSTAPNFSDVKSTDYYAGYTAAAKRLGITAGIGNGKFGAGMKVTREMMFQLVYNILTVIDEVPEVLSGPSVSLFDDSGSIESFYTPGISALVRCGIIVGTSSTENLLSPKANATRATMVQVLYNILSK